MSRYPDYQYENTPRTGYELGDGNGTAYFLPICTQCGRYVKMDSSIYWSEHGGLSKQPNATCSKCGRVKIECELID